ncbi:MAG: metal ABC transporter substrate-binding protein, partial [Gemmatimonadetes bacterium]|nr:metal ABC transporter substrate-binding protein [Gemmatimonadota bacterium]
NAEVIFVNGLGFETWSQTLIETSATQAKVFVATDGITPLKVDGAIDPHAWNSLTNGMKYVANIADGMAETDPQNAAAYKANARAYTARLKALHDRALGQLKRLPAGQRTVVTAHDAFGYLEAAYGLTFLAPVGIDTDAEPSARDLAELIDHLKAVGAGALFVENITSPSLIQQIAHETGIQIGGRLFSDALSERGGPATSYEKMFEHNLGTLIQALSPKS